jgi:hypothetical protein
LKQISDKYETFGELGVIVFASLLQLKRDTTAFSDPIVSKLPGFEAGIAPGIVMTLRRHLIGRWLLMRVMVSFHIRS